MAKALPVLATRWGGPADYLDDSTGILIDPTNPGQFTQALTNGLVRLARDPALRLTLGQAARRRVQERYDWQGKIDQIISIYREAQART
jgi:glycosyltransferase involved in cell wall biosynthesis